MKFKSLMIIIVVLVIIFGGLYLFLTQTEIENQEVVNEEPLIGGDQDEHGCLIAAGYSWCEANQQCLRFWEQGCEDYIYSLYEQVKAVTGLEFLEPIADQLTWQVEAEEGVNTLTLDSFTTNASKLTDENFKMLKEFLEANFSADQFNVMGSTVGQFIAYKRDSLSLVCVLSASPSDFNPDDEKYIPQSLEKDVKLNCAILDKSLVPIISSAKRIKEAFAEKYSVKASQVVLDISQETENYARGGVKFLPADETSEGGLFLATKVDNVWQLVFDGNGSYTCQSIAEYNFPAEMIFDCTE